MKRLLLAASAAALLLTSVSASAGDLTKDAKLTSGPPIKEVVGPYDSGLQCLSTVLTPEQKAVSFSAGFFPDRTGKTNYVADSGTGTFSSQGMEDMILTSLSRTGVTVVDSSPVLKGSIDWTINKMAMARYPAGQGPNISIIYPDVVINGAITTFDFLPGSGADINIGGVRLAHQQTRILVSMDARAVLMPGSKLAGPGGKVIATDRPSKQIVGYQDSAGGTGFFGPSGSKTFVSLDFGHKPNEAIQYAERIVIDRMVFILVSKTFNVTSCQAQLDWGDTMANLQ